MQTDLYKKLSYVTAYREHRQDAADVILENKKLVPELLSHCFSNDKDVSFKACWVLEYVCKEKLEWLLPHIDFFVEHIGSVKHDSAVRPIAKICELLCTEYFSKKPSQIKEVLTDGHLEKITEVNFDWIISDEKVAVKAYAMNSLFLLGKKHEWVHPELKKTLESGFGQHSAAYKARARHLLEKLNRSQINPKP